MQVTVVLNCSLIQSKLLLHLLIISLTTELKVQNLSPSDFEDTDHYIQDSIAVDEVFLCQPGSFLGLLGQEAMIYLLSKETPVWYLQVMFKTLLNLLSL